MLNTCHENPMDTHLKLGFRDSYYYRGIARLPIDDHYRHMLISGSSGTGKSTLLANLWAQHCNAGRGALLIDPHGDLAETALDLVPPRRIRKTIYINPADLDNPVGFNVLYGVRPEDRASRAADVVSAFKSVWGDSWGPRLEYILYNSIAALLETQGSTLLCIPRLLVNKTYRATITAQLRDPIVSQFWRDEFPQIEKKLGQEALLPVLNKVGQLLSAPILRNILGQPKSTINPRHLMDNNYLVIANLSKGRLGEQHANLLGALLVSSFGSTALSRADMPAADRKCFAMIVDEFPNYTTSAFISLLSEARKYRLSLTLAHQYLDQMSDHTRASVLGNVGSLITFRVGAEDAAIFARALSLPNPQQVIDTSKYQAWSRVSQHGQPSDTFLLRTDPPPQSHGNSSKIIEYSRMHFACRRNDVESRILRFLAADHAHTRASRRRTQW